MRRTRIKVGISAIFDPRRTAHARTFLRAIGMACNRLPEVAALQLVYADDGACGAQAAQVAHGFVRQGVDLVLGHFSSDAAATAADIYGRHGIPLLLPAATATMLTAGRPHVFRLCATDALLAARLAAHARQRGWRRLSLEHDDSLHGRLLAQAIREAGERAGMVFTDDAQAQAAVFAGRLGASNRFVAARRAAGDTRALLLTDDAVSQHLFDGIAAPGDVAVFGFPSSSMVRSACALQAAHVAAHGAMPDMYFLESLAALAVAAQLTPADPLSQLRGTVFNTPAGAISFTNGERDNAPHALWIASGGVLTPALLIQDLPRI